MFPLLLNMLGQRKSFLSPVIHISKKGIDASFAQDIPN